MIENSYIGDKKISKSLTKLNRISSDNKFRVKSLRMKTEQKQSQHQSPMKTSTNFPSILKVTKQNSPIRHLTTNHADVSQMLINSKLRVKSTVALEKDYEHELQTRLHVPRTIVQQIFNLKLQYEQIKPTQEKYAQFCKMIYLRLMDKVEISMQGFNLRNQALKRFLQFFLEWKEKNIIGLDLSMFSELAYKMKTKQQEEQQLMNNKVNNKLQTQPNIDEPLFPMKYLLLNLIQKDHRLTKLSIRNIHLSPQQMSQLLRQVLLSHRIYCLDISNKTSQSINRLGNDCVYLQEFFAKNQTLAIMKMDNLNITDECVQKMSHGITRNVANNPLRILSLAGNLLTHQSLGSIFSIMTRAALTELNLSNNSLGRQFFMSAKNLRISTIKSLDLSSTQMDSQSLIHFLSQLSQNKFLQILKLDNNDFSHHWFNKIDDVIASNLSLQSLSMVNCGIKNFSSFFQGLVHSRYLARVNLNYNLVSLQEENIPSVINCLKTNKILQQLRMRFCGYNEPVIVQLVECLKVNKKLELIDISENHLSDFGGNEIVKLLTQNKLIKEFGIQKLQLTVRMTEEIQNLLIHNRQLREKQQFTNLIDQNKTYKARDVLSWNDIQKLEENAKKLQRLTLQLRAKNQQTQAKINLQRQMILEKRKQSKNQERKLQKQIKKEEHRIQSVIRKTNGEIQNIILTEKQYKEAVQIQLNLIKSLENRIVKENQKIKKRQTQLEDQFRDEKYLQRRKQKIEKQKLQSKKQSQQSIKGKNSGDIFDNTKGLRSLTKRKSSTIQKKG